MGINHRGPEGKIGYIFIRHKLMGPQKLLEIRQYNLFYQKSLVIPIAYILILHRFCQLKK
jgi:hypothetical protein